MAVDNQELSYQLVTSFNLLTKLFGLLQNCREATMKCDILFAISNSVCEQPEIAAELLKDVYLIEKIVFLCPYYDKEPLPENVRREA